MELHYLAVIQSCISGQLFDWNMVVNINVDLYPSPPKKNEKTFIAPI